MDQLSLTIEALVFSSVNPLSLLEIQQILDETFEVKYETREIERALNELIEKYNTHEFAIELTEISGGFTFMSKPLFYNAIAVMVKQTERKKLSKAAIETLSIIAYKQPVTKSEIEGIRGVNCDYAIQKLLERDLIDITGRTDGPGRPLIFKTSKFFMDYFGLKSVRDLPQLKEVLVPENSIGQPETS